MAADVISLDYPSLDEAGVAALACRLAPLLGAGDLLLLSGPLGAGKTTFARALIRQRLDDPALEVASPSFALVIGYASADGPDIRHVDLYRIDDPAELPELGLEDEMDETVTLLEWPEHGYDFGAFAPLAIEIRPAGAGRRHLRLQGGRRWADRLAALESRIS